MLELLVCIQCSGKRQQREDKQKKYHILNAHLVPAASDWSSTSFRRQYERQDLKNKNKNTSTGECGKLYRLVTFGRQTYVQRQNNKDTHVKKVSQLLKEVVSHQIKIINSTKKEVK